MTAVAFQVTAVLMGMSGLTFGVTGPPLVGAVYFAASGLFCIAGELAARRERP